VDSWPKHCVADTDGANFHRNLKAVFDRVFFKGQYSAAYSGFEGRSGAGQTLEDYLKKAGITHVDVVGIAYDYCVRATALDAVDLGFKTRVLSELTVAVHSDKDSLDATRTALVGSGVEVVA
jgi:nicotinamidase/pyrazinamidase